MSLKVPAESRSGAELFRLTDARRVSNLARL
jgi:hypothetical protein